MADGKPFAENKKCDLLNSVVNDGGHVYCAGGRSKKKNCPPVPTQNISIADDSTAYNLDSKPIVLVQ